MAEEDQISVALDGLPTSTGKPVDYFGRRVVEVSDASGRLSGWYVVRGDGVLIPFDGGE